MYLWCVSYWERLFNCVHKGWICRQSHVVNICAIQSWGCILQYLMESWWLYACQGILFGGCSLYGKIWLWLWFYCFFQASLTQWMASIYCVNCPHSLCLLIRAWWIVNTLEEDVSDDQEMTRWSNLIICWILTLRLSLSYYNWVVLQLW